MKTINKNLIGFIGKIGSGKDEVTKMLKYITVCHESHRIISFDEYTELTDDYFTHLYKLGYKNIKFATELKKLVANLLDVSVETLENREFKNTPIKSLELKKIVFGNPIKEQYSVNISSKIGNPEYHRKSGFKVVSEEIIEVTPRWLMINIGTEAFRNIISKDWWVMQTFKTYTEDSKWIISDVRFPNEADTIKYYNGINIAIKRPFGMRFPKYAELSNPEDIYETPKALAEIDPKLYSEITSESEVILDDYNKWAHIVIENDSTLEQLFNKVLDIYNEFYA